jgi:hypothetical protein
MAPFDMVLITNTLSRAPLPFIENRSMPACAPAIADWLELSQPAAGASFRIFPITNPQNWMIPLQYFNRGTGTLPVWFLRLQMNQWRTGSLQNHTGSVPVPPKANPQFPSRLACGCQHSGEWVSD